jgi:hypothetical protein
MTMETKSLNVHSQIDRGEPWRRARLVQRVSPHLGEADRPWQWNWMIALGSALVLLVVLLLYFV